MKNTKKKIIKEKPILVENVAEKDLVKRVLMNAVEIIENEANNVKTNQKSNDAPNVSREKSLNVSFKKKDKVKMI